MLEQGIRSFPRNSSLLAEQYSWDILLVGWQLQFYLCTGLWFLVWLTVCLLCDPLPGELLWAQVSHLESGLTPAGGGDFQVVSAVALIYTM